MDLLWLSLICESATGLLNWYCVVVGPPQLPSGFFTATAGFCLIAIFNKSPLEVFTTSLVWLTLKLVPIFSHFLVWLSTFNRIEYRLKPDPCTTPCCLKYSAPR